MAPQNLQLGERLVTTYTLKGRLADVSQVTVGAKTVVTPAAKDMLNDRGVQLVRSN
jgi:ethanolamine utilization cobalamin adenosyltransferase